MSQTIIADCIAEVPEEFDKLFPLEEIPNVKGDMKLPKVGELVRPHQRVTVLEAADHDDYHLLRAFIYIGKINSPTGVGYKRAVVQCDDEYKTPKEPFESFLTPDTLYVVQTPPFLYKGEFNGEDGLHTQKKAMAVAEKAADHVMKQLAETGTVKTEE